MLKTSVERYSSNLQTECYGLFSDGQTRPMRRRSWLSAIGSLFVPSFSIFHPASNTVFVSGCIERTWDKLESWIQGTAGNKPTIRISTLQPSRVSMMQYVLQALPSGTLLAPESAITGVTSTPQEVEVARNGTVFLAVLANAGKASLSRQFGGEEYGGSAKLTHGGSECWMMKPASGRCRHNV